MMESFIGNGSEVLVVGGGRSGLSASHLALDLGASVSVVDDSPQIFSSPEWMRLGKRGARFLRERTIGPWIAKRKTPVLISPGVPPIKWSGEVVAPVYAHVRGELEWASSLWPFPIIAVSGTNGKSTTTALIAHLLSEMGLTPFIGGNYGIPLSEGVREVQRAIERGDDSPYDSGVIEVSSFQTESMQAFSPEIYLLLNITPDHLDRYGRFDLYREAKLHPLSLFGPGTTVIWNGDQDDFREGISRGASQRAFVTRGETPREDFDRSPVARISQDHIDIFSLPGDAGSVQVKTERYGLAGGGNAENLAFSILSVLLFLKNRDRPLLLSRLEEAIGRFQGLPHRMENVATVRGVVFVNDSKATNVGAVEAALAGLPETSSPHTILIMGGRDKGGSYLPLLPGIRRHVKEIVVLGEARDRIREQLSPYVPVEVASDFFEAVARAFSIADEGEMVLLSPACSSYDMFHGYEERGDKFREAVKRLAAQFGEGGRVDAISR